VFDIAQGAARADFDCFFGLAAEFILYCW